MGLRPNEAHAFEREYFYADKPGPNGKMVSRLCVRMVLKKEYGGPGAIPLW